MVTVAVGQINGGLSDCGPPTMQGASNLRGWSAQDFRTLEMCDNDKYPYPIQIHLIDTRILDLEWAVTIYIFVSLDSGHYLWGWGENSKIAQA